MSCPSPASPRFLLLEKPMPDNEEGLLLGREDRMSVMLVLVVLALLMIPRMLLMTMDY
jgi:hypothetical protein